MPSLKIDLIVDDKGNVVISKTTKDLEGLNRQAEQTGKALSGAHGSIDTTHQKLGTLDGNLIAVKGSLIGVAAAFGTIYAAVGAGKQFVDAALAMERINTSLNAVYGANAAAELKYIKDESQRLGLVVNDTAMAYMKFSAAAKGSVLEGEGTRKIFSAVAEAATAMKLSGDETHGTFVALSQMMSKGKISAEELRQQLGERLPGAIQLMAKALNVTTAELFKMMEEGKLMSADVLPKFAEELHKTYGDAATLAADKGQAAINRFNSALMESKSIIGEQLMPTITNYATTLAGFLKWVNENAKAGEVAGNEAYVAGLRQYYNKLIERGKGETSEAKRIAAIIQEKQFKTSDYTALAAMYDTETGIQLRDKGIETGAGTDGKTLKGTSWGADLYKQMIAPAMVEAKFDKILLDMEETEREAIRKMAEDDIKTNVAALAAIESETQKSLNASQDAYKKSYEVMEGLRDSDVNQHRRYLTKIDAEETKAVQTISNAWYKGPMSPESTAQYLEDLAYIHQAYNDKRMKAEAEHAEKELRHQIDIARQSDSLYAGMKAGFEDMIAHQMKWGDVGYRAFAGLQDNMARAFSSGFYDAVKGDWDNLGDLWQGFCDDMLKSFSGILGDMIAEAAMKEIVLLFKSDWIEGGEKVLGIVSDVLGFAKGIYNSVAGGGSSSTLQEGTGVLAPGAGTGYEGMNLAFGGRVPGAASGMDSYINDTVKAMLSPGEYVIPSSLVSTLERQGRAGDTMLAHINPAEAAILKMLGGSGTINPRTGLREFATSGTLDMPNWGYTRSGTLPTLQVATSNGQQLYYVPQELLLHSVIDPSGIAHYPVVSADVINQMRGLSLTNAAPGWSEAAASGWRFLGDFLPGHGFNIVSDPGRFERGYLVDPAQYSGIFDGGLVGTPAHLRHLDIMREMSLQSDATYAQILKKSSHLYQASLNPRSNAWNFNEDWTGGPSELEQYATMAGQIVATIGGAYLGGTYLGPALSPALGATAGAAVGTGIGAGVASAGYSAALGQDTQSIIRAGVMAALTTGAMKAISGIYNGPADITEEIFFAKPPWYQVLGTKALDTAVKWAVRSAIGMGVNAFTGDSGGQMQMSFQGADDNGLLSTLAGLMGEMTAPKTFAFNARNGLDYVPYDNFPINAHRGEAVLTKEENAQRMGKGQTLVINELRLFIGDEEFKGYIKAVSDGVIVERNGRGINPTSRVYR